MGGERETVVEKKDTKGDSIKDLGGLRIHENNAEVHFHDDSVKTEILAAELLLPVKVMNAMLMAQRFVVPLNCAFIQMNGGLGEFE